MWRRMIALVAILLLNLLIPRAMAQQPKLRLRLQAKDGIFSVSFSHDSRLLAGACADGTIQVWNVFTGKLEANLTGPSAKVTTLSFHPKKYLLASGDLDGNVRLLELPSGKVKASVRGPAGVAGVNSLAFSHDGKLLASSGFGQGGNDQAVSVWDVDSTRKVSGISMTYGGGGVTVHSVAFQGDKKRLALGTHYHEIALWDMEKGRMESTLKGHREDVFAVSFSSDGKILASGSGDRTVKLWDPFAARERATLKGHTDWVHTVAVSPNGRLVASGSHDKSVRLWDTATGQQKAVLKGHNAWVFAVAFSRNGKLLASSAGGPDKGPGELRLWEISD